MVCGGFHFNSLHFFLALIHVVNSEHFIVWLGWVQVGRICEWKMWKFQSWHCKVSYNSQHVMSLRLLKFRNSQIIQNIRHMRIWYFLWCYKSSKFWEFNPSKLASLLVTKFSKFPSSFLSLQKHFNLCLQGNSTPIFHCKNYWNVSYDVFADVTHSRHVFKQTMWAFMQN